MRMVSVSACSALSQGRGWTSASHIVVGFAAVQTVFEDFGSNTWERMLANHSRYALGIPFGHDAGDEQDGAGSELMRRYKVPDSATLDVVRDCVARSVHLLYHPA